MVSKARSASCISEIIDKVLLGVIVLESLGSKVDPATGTLEKNRCFLYGSFALKQVAGLVNRKPNPTEKR